MTPSTAPPTTPARIPPVARQLAEAMDMLDQRRRAWEKHGRAQVPDALLAEAAAHVQGLGHRLGQLRDGLYRVRRAQLFFHALRKGFASALGLESLDWLSASLLIATPAFGLPVLLIAFGVGVWQVFAAAGIAFFGVTLA